MIAASVVPAAGLLLNSTLYRITGFLCEHDLILCDYASKTELAQINGKDSYTPCRAMHT